MILDGPHKAMMEHVVVIHHADLGAEDESQSHQECGLEVHRASDHFLVESACLTHQLLVSNDWQPCYEVTRNKDW